MQYPNAQDDDQRGIERSRGRLDMDRNFLTTFFSERRYIASAPNLSSTAELSKSCGALCRGGKDFTAQLRIGR